MTGFFEDHLNLDSIVAFVDGELSLTAYQRAAAHLAGCPMCASDVSEQSFARDSLRSAAAPSMPGSLAAMLVSIPIAAPVAARPPGVGLDLHTGHAIRISHLGREATRGRRFRLGAGALMAGIAVGALATAGPGQSEEPAPGPGGNGTNRPASFSPGPTAVVQPAVLTGTPSSTGTDSPPADHRSR